MLIVDLDLCIVPRPFRLRPGYSTAFWRLASSVASLRYIWPHDTGHGVI